jgi:hypothetical protein
MSDPPLEDMARMADEIAGDLGGRLTGEFRVEPPSTPACHAYVWRMWKDG